MKKRVFEMVFFSMLVLVLVIVLFGFASAGFLDKLFSPKSSPFNVSITLDNNVAPMILDLQSPVLMCENTALSRLFNVSDVNFNIESVKLVIASPFFAGFTNPLPLSESVEEAEIFSALLNKTFVGLYPVRVTARDKGDLIDFVDLDIEVIEINNEPNITPVGVKTVWTVGDESTFFHQVQVTDVEDDDQDAENLIFDLVFFDGVIPFFDILHNGTMDFTPDVSDIGVYNLSVCVTDLGITNIHPSISLCGQDGSKIEACDNFTLTVTDENRPPNITTHYPLDLNFSVAGLELIEFNITDRDPDGTIPDTEWYVDDVLREFDPANSTDEFSYVFGCGVSGEHIVRVKSTDGLLNDTLEWNVTVQFVSCGDPSGGNGGGPREISCGEKWGCLEWNTCQDADLSFELGVLPRSQLLSVQESCESSFIPDESCGFQVRSCIDVNLCNNTEFKPEELGRCFFLEAPSCSDGIANCHDGFCESLVDCGGGCEACASCSDGIRNQGERKVDCGGPCPFDCPATLPFFQKIRVQYILITLISLLLIFMIVQLVRIYSAKKRVGSKTVSYPSKGRAIYED